MFEGMSVGRTDSAGRDIRCDCRVLFHEHMDGFRVTSTEDGWGRDRPLCRHDQLDVPSQDKDYFGRVVYSESMCQFVVKWDEKHKVTSWGSNQHRPRQGEDSLSSLLAPNKPGCSLTMIDPA